MVIFYTVGFLKSSVFVIAFAAVLISNCFAGAPVPDAHEIMHQADQRARGKTSHMKVDIQVIRPDWNRELSLETWSEGSDKTLGVILAPARDQGTAFLKRGREVWNWVPSVERTIKLPPSMMSQSWMGTDMTNEDFVREASMVEDYTQAILGTDTLLQRPAWKLELKPKPGAPVVWGKIVVWIDQKDFVEMRVEFYDEDGSLVNTLRALEIGKLGGRLLPTRLEMIPADKPGNKTVIHYTLSEFDQPIPDRYFTQRYLSSFH